MERGGSHMNVGHKRLIFLTGYTVHLERFRSLMSTGLYFRLSHSNLQIFKITLTTFFLKEIRISRSMYHQENLHKNNTIITKIMHIELTNQATSGLRRAFFVAKSSITSS